VPTDVRYRLSVEGDAAVIAAFRRIQAASQSNVGAVTSAFGGFGAVLGKVNGLLAILGIAVTAASLVSAGRNAAESADQFGKMSQRLGTTVKNFSVLSLAAKLADVDIASSTRSLAKFITATEQAAEGAGGGAKTLKSLGFQMSEIKALADKDLVERLAAVSEKFAAIPDSARKSAAAFQLFGNRGAALIPLMNEMGSQGFDRLAERTEALGARFDDKLVGAITESNDKIKLLQVSMNAMAVQFVGALAPSIIQSVNAIGVSIEGTAANIRVIADIIAFPFKVILGLVIDVSLAVGGLGKAFVQLSEGLFEFLERLAHADFVGATDRFAEWGEKAGKTLEDMNLRGTKVWKSLFTPPEEVKRQARDDLSNLDDLFSKTLEATRARLDAELAIQRARTKLMEQEQQSRYEDALVDVRTYYDSRSKIVTDSINAEIEKLKERAAAEAANPDEQEAAIAVAKTKSEIKQREIELQSELMKLQSEESKETKRLGEEGLTIVRRALELQGRRHEAAMIDMDNELRKARENIDKLGPILGSVEERRQLLETYKTALQLEVDLNQVSHDANAELAAYSRDRERIQKIADAGLISEAEAQRRLLALDDERIDSLRAISAQQTTLADATGDPDKVAQAQAFADSVDEIQLSMDAARDSSAKLKVAIEDSLVAGAATFFSDAVRSARSFQDVLTSVGLSVLNTLNQIIAKMLEVRFAGLLAGIGGAAASGHELLSTGEIVPKAAGGLLTGPGTGTSDSFLVAASNREFFVRAAVVEQPGVLQHLTDLNKFGLAALNRPIQRFADGGEAQTPPTARVDGVVEVRLGDALEGWLTTPTGERSFLKLVGKHRRSIGRMVK